MADRITLDFETGMITWDTGSQQGTECCPELAQRKNAILAAMGYEAINFSPAVDAVTAFINGEISGEELTKRLENWEKEDPRKG